MPEAPAGQDEMGDFRLNIQSDLRFAFLLTLRIALEFIGTENNKKDPLGNYIYFWKGDK